MDVENIRLSVQFLSGTSYNLNCVSFTSREKVYLFTRLMFNVEKKLNSYFLYTNTQPNCPKTTSASTKPLQEKGLVNFTIMYLPEV